MVSHQSRRIAFSHKASNGLTLYGTAWRAHLAAVIHNLMNFTNVQGRRWYMVSDETQSPVARHTMSIFFVFELCSLYFNEPSLYFCQETLLFDFIGLPKEQFGSLSVQVSTSRSNQRMQVYGIRATRQRHKPEVWSISWTRGQQGSELDPSSLSPLYNEEEIRRSETSNGQWNLAGLTLLLKYPWRLALPPHLALLIWSLCTSRPWSNQEY